MDTTDDSREQDLIERLRRPAEVPLGMIARLETAVRRRARADTGLHREEKLAFGAAAVGVALAMGGGGEAVALLVGALGVAAYLQWTVLVEDRHE
ncbi:MAG: hypothetical protein ABJB33_02785 [Gemmatimonadota bacterium]